MKRTHLLILLILVVSISGCDQWPPRNEDTSKHFHVNKEALVALRDEFLAMDVQAIDHSILAGVGVPKDPLVRKEWERILKQSDKFTRLLDDAGVMGISRKKGVIYFELATPIRSGTQYRIRYATGSENQSRACQPEFKEVACGACSVSIDNQWWIKYSWYPEDTEVEITQCFAEGMEKIDKLRHD